MINIIPAGQEHELFASWAKERGVQISGVGPAKITGRGLGMVALTRIEAGEELVRVPASALLTVESIPPEFRDLYNCKGLTVQGLLASFLAFGADLMLPYAPWKATWPSLADFQASMPILWPSELRESLLSRRRDGTSTASFFPLPPAIGSRWATSATGAAQPPNPSLLWKQQKRLEGDWAIVSKIMPESAHERYAAYATMWLLVNTRSFYYELPDAKIQPAREDRMVLCPFVDYFNHADQGCDVSFNRTGFTVVSGRSYDVGEEIFTSYGSHSNDFLLVEYGFILETNKWDSLPIDHLLLPSIKAPMKHRLETEGYFGSYALSAEGLCHRTQVAVRTQTLSYRNWKRYVAGLEVDDPMDKVKADAFILSRILEVYYTEAEHALACLTELGDDIGQGRWEVLMKRWTQIRKLVIEAVKNEINTVTGAKFLDERKG